MVYIYYDSTGNVQNILELSGFDPKSNHSFLEDNAPDNCKCLKKESVEYDLIKYEYSVVNDELVRGQERLLLIPNTPTPEERLLAVEKAILNLMF